MPNQLPDGLLNLPVKEAEEVKKRLDVILVEKGFFDTRERARRSIMAGVVFVNGQKSDKPGTKFDEDISIEVREDPNPYVGRGGLKLARALEVFDIDLTGLTAIDVGASIGGFTDCMLRNGASKVIAIDVGYGQMAWKLRNDPRVIVMDRTNIRYVSKTDLGCIADFAAIDVSFISLRLVIPVVKELLGDEGEMVCLVKPQFEAGRGSVGKKGVVRDEGTHFQVLKDIAEFSAGCGLTVKGVTYSPIKGAEGNIEYLLYISKEGGGKDLSGEEIRNLVNEAHSTLK